MIFTCGSAFGAGPTSDEEVDDEDEDEICAAGGSCDPDGDTSAGCVESSLWKFA